jgi:hypothetical protein
MQESANSSSESLALPGPKKLFEIEPTSPNSRQKFRPFWMLEAQDWSVRIL